MSDFAGIWRLDGRPIEAADLNRLAQGLDGRGIGPARIWKSGPIALVHRQHIFTPEDRLERQPKAGPSGLVLAADLFLTERDDLAARLDLAQPQRLADGDLLLAALQQWGAETTLARLYGRFSFALWDPATRRLTLARDHEGGGTLFLHRSDRLVAFSNRLRPLLALPEIPRDLDEESLADFMILNPERPERTLYRSIDRIPMGHLAVIGPDSFHSARWWSLPRPGTLRLPEPQLLEAAHDHLDRAVAACLRSDGPPSLAMTGGLDTASVALAASRQTDRPLLAITRKPTPPLPTETATLYFDETSRAATTASRLPMLDWQEVPEDDGDWGEHDPNRWFLESGRPHRGLNNNAWFFPLYRFMAARGSKVMLAGDRGNRIFSQPAPSYLGEMLATGKWLSLSRILCNLHRHQGQSWAELAKITLRPFEPMSWRQRRLKRQGQPWSFHSALSPALAQELNLVERLDGSDYRLRLGGSLSSFHDARQWLMEDETPRDATPGIRAMSGIDIRAPLADRRLTEFFAALPAEEFLKGGWTRSLTRRMLAGHLPDEVVFARKSGRQLGDWHHLLQNQRSAQEERLRRAEASALAGHIVDLPALRQLLDGLPADADTAEAEKSGYLQKLTRGLDMASFLVWHDGGNG